MNAIAVQLCLLVFAVLHMTWVFSKLLDIIAKELRLIRKHFCKDEDE